MINRSAGIGDNTAPFSPAVQTDVVDAIADWCEALHGSLPLQEAFAHFAIGLGAEAGMLVRTHVSDFRPVRVAMWDRRADNTIAPLRTSFADSFFGPAIARPKVASIWLASDHNDDPSHHPDPALESWQERRSLSEFVVLALTGGGVTRDHIELHFQTPLSPEKLATLNSVLPPMARTWASRQVGLVTRSVVNHRTVTELPRPSRPKPALLGPANPAGLSRAEFRVCILLARGLSVVGVASELAVSDSTVRSHLRNVYAKTETSTLAELVYNLVTSAAEPVPSDPRCA
ncbi:helix-turn-helix transcriptional regulator [Defluviimonas sp. WL0024]|uniref:Helix-turn-helix transcriptional regulator n=1 Tax=Albidovulum salinarum TaxID=2984153 RepID=A0ABT2X1M8_9RHOB|nr:helix-turn-helix transcriptional regulator [Defluviimonas sp. WL0024]MCU9847846.1 helix-turn-helix transcriptional regulator [Defluviimonas sp. WL0024]